MHLPSGYTIKFRHDREVTKTLKRMHSLGDFEEFSPRTGRGTVNALYQETYELNPRGGATVCFIQDADRRTVAEGTAICNPADNFVKAIGRAKAQGMAMQQLKRRQRAIEEGRTLPELEY